MNYVARIITDTNMIQKQKSSEQYVRDLGFDTHKKDNTKSALHFSSVQLLSHVQLFDSMDCSTPGFPVHHKLLELAQTHVHRVRDATQPSHPVSPSFPAFNLSQHHGLFQWVSSLHQMPKVLELQL